MNSVGKLIQSARLSKNISLNQVANNLKISLHTLQRIEDDNIMLDADVVFYIGHIRSYSDYLDLDTNEIIGIFKEQISYKKNHHAEKILKPDFNNNLITFKKFLPISLIVLIFISFYILFIDNDNPNQYNYALIPDLPENYLPIIEKVNIQEMQKKSEIQTDSQNFSNETFSLTSANASNQKTNTVKQNIVTLKLLNPTWIQLRDKSNNIIISKLMDKDEEFSYELDLQYNITAGNAGNILVMINTDVRGKIGKYGDIVDSIILDYNFNN